MQLVIPMRRKGPARPSRRRHRWPEHVEQVVRRLADVVTHIETERLVLRQPTPADADGRARAMDGTMRAAMGWTEQHTAGVLTETVELAARGQLGTRVVLTHRVTGEILGEITFFNLDLRRCSCEIGWWTRPTARGQGYGTEATAAFVSALHAAGIRRIWIGTAPDNVAVRRTAARIGARHVENGRLRLPNGAMTRALWFAHDG